MINKLNLKTHDRVKLVNLGPENIVDGQPPITGRLGSIVGVAMRHIIDHYIVLLDHAVKTDDFLHIAVSIPETCLERI